MRTSWCRTASGRSGRRTATIASSPGRVPSSFASPGTASSDVRRVVSVQGIPSALVDAVRDDAPERFALRGGSRTFDTSTMLPDRRHRRSARLRTHRTGPLVAALVLVLAASCTSEPERRDLPDVDIDVTADPTIDAPSAGPAPTVASKVAGLPGRLAILNAAGDLVTMNPDGSHELVLDRVEAGRSQVRQPTWSPDGRSVAWVHVEITEAGALSSAVATSTGDGTRPTEARTAVVPFYLSWDPTSSRIAYLGSPSEDDIELGILEVAGRSSGTPLDTGRPFYLSWAPNGDQLFVHVGEDRLERLGLDGSLTTVAERPGTFSAPVWTADGRTFVYASIDAERPTARRAGRPRRERTGPRPLRRADRLRRQPGRRADRVPGDRGAERAPALGRRRRHRRDRRDHRCRDRGVLLEPRRRTPPVPGPGSPTKSSSGSDGACGTGRPRSSRRASSRAC